MLSVEDLNVWFGFAPERIDAVRQVRFVPLVEGLGPN